jgi:hypothetical protein
VRTTLSENSYQMPAETRTVRRGGTTYQQNTAAIGPESHLAPPSPDPSSALPKTPCRSRSNAASRFVLGTEAWGAVPFLISPIIPIGVKADSFGVLKRAGV